MNTRAESQLSSVSACLDDALTALREAQETAAILIREMDSKDPRKLVLKRVSRHADWIRDINKDLHQLEMLTTGEA